MFGGKFPKKKPGDGLSAEHVNALSEVAHSQAYPNMGSFSHGTGKGTANLPPFVQRVVVVTDIEFDGDEDLYSIQMRYWNEDDGVWDTDTELDGEYPLDPLNLSVEVGDVLSAYWDPQRDAFIPLIGKFEDASNGGGDPSTGGCECYRHVKVNWVDPQLGPCCKSHVTWYSGRLNRYFYLQEDGTLSTYNEDENLDNPITYECPDPENFGEVLTDSYDLVITVGLTSCSASLVARGDEQCCVRSATFSGGKWICGGGNKLTIQNYCNILDLDIPYCLCVVPKVPEPIDVACIVNIVEEGSAITDSGSGDPVYSPLRAAEYMALDGFTVDNLQTPSGEPCCDVWEVENKAWIEDPPLRLRGDGSVGWNATRNGPPAYSDSDCDGDAAGGSFFINSFRFYATFLPCEISDDQLKCGKLTIVYTYSLAAIGRPFPCVSGYLSQFTAVYWLHDFGDPPKDLTQRLEFSIDHTLSNTAGFVDVPNVVYLEPDTTIETVNTLPESSDESGYCDDVDCVDCGSTPEPPSSTTSTPPPTTTEEEGEVYCCDTIFGNCFGPVPESSCVGLDYGAYNSLAECVAYCESSPTSSTIPPTTTSPPTTTGSTIPPTTTPPPTTTSGSTFPP